VGTGKAPFCLVLPVPFQVLLADRIVIQVMLDWT